MEKALKMGESNACMRRIVAAPTAGSCGVIPAVFISYETYFKALEDDMVKALLIASGIGAVIAENASIAGASGGCQAEIGSASAMAAAGLTFLQGGDSLQIDKDEQYKRFKEREQNPNKEWKITDEDWRNREKWDAYEAAVNEMLVRTSTDYAPWTIVEGNNKYYARLKVLKTVIEMFEKRLKD